MSVGRLWTSEDDCTDVHSVEVAVLVGQAGDLPPLGSWLWAPGSWRFTRLWESPELQFWDSLPRQSAATHGQAIPRAHVSRAWEDAETRKRVPSSSVTHPDVQCPRHAGPFRRAATAAEAYGRARGRVASSAHAAAARARDPHRLCRLLHHQPVRGALAVGRLLPAHLRVLLAPHQAQLEHPRRVAGAVDLHQPRHPVGHLERCRAMAHGQSREDLGIHWRGRHAAGLRRRLLPVGPRRQPRRLHRRMGRPDARHQRADSHVHRLRECDWTVLFCTDGSSCSGPLPITTAPSSSSTSCRRPFSTSTGSSTSCR